MDAVEEGEPPAPVLLLVGWDGGEDRKGRGGVEDAADDDASEGSADEDEAETCSPVALPALLMIGELVVEEGMEVSLPDGAGKIPRAGRGGGAGVGGCRGGGG